jgi:hypothetical protein
MVNNCANPQCAKPLLYLREGRVFVFEMGDKGSKRSQGEKRTRHLEHFWLCGNCSQQFQVEQTETGMRLVPRRQVRMRTRETVLDTALAS